MYRPTVLLRRGLPLLEEQPPRLPWDLVECRHCQCSSHVIVPSQIKEGAPPRQLWANDVAGCIERRIIPERHRLRSLTVSLGPASHQDVAQSLLESAGSLRTLDVRTTVQMFSIPATTMKAISQFARHITILRLRDITTSLSSLKFPALAKLTFLITTSTTRKPGAADLVKFLKQSPILEELNLCLPESFKADKPAGTVALTHLKSAVFNGCLAPEENSISVGVIPYLILPNQSITVDVQTGSRAFSSDTSSLRSVIQLGDAILPRQSITAAAIQIKDDFLGFFDTSVFPGSMMIGLG